MKKLSRFDHHERREWELQERALHAERRGDAPSDDPRVMQYRLVARALRQPLFDPMPADFARHVATRLQFSMDAADERFEIWLQRGLVALFAIASVGTLLYFGNDWWNELALAARQSFNLEFIAVGSWTIPLAACLGVSWLVGRWRPTR
jgi:hypothetical protein